MALPRGPDGLLWPSVGEHLGKQRIGAMHKPRNGVRTRHDSLCPGTENLRPRMHCRSEPASELDAAPRVAASAGSRDNALPFGQLRDVEPDAEGRFAIVLHRDWEDGAD